MRVVFDTNVLLDVIFDRPGKENALKLVKAILDEKISGIISASSITDVYYMAKKGIGDRAAREAIFDLIALFDVAAVDGDVCSMALNIPMNDYEDAVLAVCAAREEADYIVTNDQVFLNADSPICVKSPASLLDMLGGDNP